MKKRAVWALWNALGDTDQMWLSKSDTMGLMGLNKAKTAAKHQEAQDEIWKRSYDVPLPSVEPYHPFYSNISTDRR